MFGNQNSQRWLIIFWAALFIVGASRYSYAANILTNGGFELGNTTNWTTPGSSGQPLAFNVTNDPSKVHSGSYAGRISTWGGQTLYILNTGSTAGIAVGSLLLGRVYIRTEDLTFAAAGMSVIMVGWDAGGNVVTWNPSGIDIKGTNSYKPIDIITQLTPGVVNAQIQVKLSSPITSGSFYIDDASIEPFDSIGGTTDNIPDCKLVKDSKGTPRLTINGVTQVPVFFMGNNQAGSPVIYDEMIKAANAGVDLNQICMDLPWTGLSNDVIDQVIKTNPNALIFPRVFIYPPQSWKDAHPDQIMKTESGTVSSASNLPSLASDLYFDEIKHQLNLFIRYIHNSSYKDKFIGYHLDYLSGGEWFYSDFNDHYYDYSEVNRQKFVQWAQSKYGTTSSLNTAWNKSYGAFNEIQIPPPAELEAGDDGVFRNPSLRRMASDYGYYFNNLTATRLIELADYVKSLTYNKSLVGYFYGYQLELCSAKGPGNGAHMGLRQVLASPNIDLICSPFSYWDRTPGYANGMMSIVDAVTAAGKIYLEEDDSRTWLWTNAEPQWYLPTEWDTLQCLRRNFGNVIGHNQAIWWMDLSGNGNYNAQSIWDNNKILVNTYKDSIANELPTTPQVALIYDQEYYCSLKADSWAVNAPSGYQQRRVFQSLGTQVGYYYIQDIPKIPSSVKLYVFVDTYHIDAEKKGLIDTIKTNNNTLLWLYAPGYVTEDNLSTVTMQEITGFNLGKQTSSIRPTITVGSSSNPIFQGIVQSFGYTDLPIAPTFYGTGSDGSVMLGYYNSGSTQPALLLKEFPTWRSIFSGAPILSVPVLRCICRYAGAPLLVDPGNMFTEDAVTYNGRYLYVYAKSHPGTRTLHVPGAPVNVLDVLTGTQLAQNVTSWNVDFIQNEQKIFKVTPPGETPTITPTPTMTGTPTNTPTSTPTIMPSPYPTLTPMPDLSVTNVSRPDYVVSPSNELRAGDLVYGDRMYTFSNPIPVHLYKKTYIMTSEADKDVTAPASFLSFDVNREVIVYVAIDQRIGTPPTWFSSWAVLSDPLITTDPDEPKRRVYSKKFAQGHITLGPNRDASMPSGRSMFTVVISPIITGAKDWKIYSQKDTGKEPGCFDGTEMTALLTQQRP